MSSLASTRSEPSPSEEIVPWVPPPLVSGVSYLDGDESSAKETAEEIELRIEHARKEGYQEGYLRGQKECTENVDAERESLSKLLKEFVHPLAVNNDAVLNELVGLSRAVAKHILKRELHTDSSLYLEMIQKICDQYALKYAAVNIHMHPDDAILIDNIGMESSVGERIKIQADSTLKRSSCLVDAGSFFLDISVDTLVERVAKEMLEISNEPARNDP
ncbi:MAG: hypothetical protein KTR32_43465 [Granulosicoccus sp.]|nr:hypothetical protein [Granulosicoccus sp.]